MDKNCSPIKYCKHGHSLEDAYEYENSWVSKKTGERKYYKYLSCRTCAKKNWTRISREKGHKPRPEYILPDDTNTLAYAAGLFDGEGSIMITLGRKPNTEYRYHRLSISITSTNREIIDWLLNVFGGKDNSHYGKGNQKQAWKWSLLSSQAEKFLRSLHPFLIIKSPQAIVAFQLRETMGRGRETPVTSDIFAKREKLRHQMRELNRRGVR